MADKDTTTPTINKIERSETNVTLHLFIDEQLRCFKGHFDGSPVTPGVVQLAWAINYAQIYLGLNGSVKDIGVLKFQKILLPNTHVQLELIKKSEQKFTFHYSEADASFSSGRVLLDN